MAAPALPVLPDVSNLSAESFANLEIGLDRYAQSLGVGFHATGLYHYGTTLTTRRFKQFYPDQLIEGVVTSQQKPPLPVKPEEFADNATNAVVSKHSRATALCIGVTTGNQTMKDALLVAMGPILQTAAADANGQLGHHTVTSLMEFLEIRIGTPTESTYEAIELRLTMPIPSPADFYACAMKMREVFVMLAKNGQAKSQKDQVACIVNVCKLLPSILVTIDQYKSQFPAVQDQKFQELVDYVEARNRKPSVTSAQMGHAASAAPQQDLATTIATLVALAVGPAVEAAMSKYAPFAAAAAPPAPPASKQQQHTWPPRATNQWPAKVTTDATKPYCFRHGYGHLGRECKEIRSYADTPDRTKMLNATSACKIGIYKSFDYKD